MDAVLAPPVEGKGGVAARSHPIPGEIMAELCTTPTLLSVAEAVYRAPAADLRLTEQVLIRTDPEPPADSPHLTPLAAEPRGWHLDFAFDPERFEPGEGRPRQTYFQMFSLYSDVLPGAGCTMVVPKSHEKTLAAAAQTDGSLELLSELRGKIVADPAAYGIDTSEGIELSAPAGSLVVFCPFTLHSASINRGTMPRYVNVQSFNHSTDADLLQNHLLKNRYLQKFHDDMHAAITPELGQVLRGRGLWGEAMKEELTAFREQGFFRVAEPLLPADLIKEVSELQKKIEPEWEAMEFPGMNRLACQFLMVLKESPKLMSIIEHGPTLSLAAELLGVDVRGVGGSPQGALVIEACGLGYHPPRTQPNRQVAWHSEPGSDLSFYTVLDPQGPNTRRAGLRVLPGSHLRNLAEVTAELRAIPGNEERQMFERHPEEQIVPLDPESHVVWSPSMWHATELQVTPNAPRRAIGWNFGVEGKHQTRDAAAVKLIFGGEWQQWPEARQKLFGVFGDKECSDSSVPDASRMRSKGIARL